MCRMCMFQWGHSGDRCDLVTTLGKYDLRKGDLFVPSWARVRRVRRGSISSEMLMCGGGVRSILLLPLVVRCIETIDVCIWHMFVFMSVDLVIVWGSVRSLLLISSLNNIIFVNFMLRMYPKCCIYIYIYIYKVRKYERANICLFKYRFVPLYRFICCQLCIINHNYILKTIII